MGGVKNARKCAAFGTEFKSRLEMDTFLALKSMGFNPVYEPITIRLLDGFTHLGFKILPVNYTPDFIITTEKDVMYIECKGYPTETWKIKRKLFLRWLRDNQPKSKYIEVFKPSDVMALNQK